MGRRLCVPLLALCAWLPACSRSSKVARGSVVRLEYVLIVDGSVDDSNEGAEPLTLTVGSGVLPRAAEEALIGMRSGEEKSLTLSAAQAYGERDPRAVSAVPRASFGPMAKDLVKGKAVLGLKDGKAARARVERIAGPTVWLDFNHRLAGQPVYFRLKVLSLARR
ncbi:MAG: FKBP-type peptidyl-prolyl cis-trans isomerase [Elusimicrobia bacterium]|nr:FKBP-type peptidyl-prolyl cis-trans isomerase [Elusimicrobiota bacterium]